MCYNNIVDASWRFGWVPTKRAQERPRYVVREALYMHYAHNRVAYTAIEKQLSEIEERYANGEIGFESFCHLVRKEMAKARITNPIPKEA